MHNKTICSIILLVIFTISPSRTTHALTHKTKAIISSVIALAGTVSTVYCYKQKRSYGEKIQELQDYIKTNEENKNDINDIDDASKEIQATNLQTLLEKQSLYEILTALSGLVTVGATGTAAYQYWKMTQENNQNNPESPELEPTKDIPVGQKIELFPGLFVIAHADDSFTIEQPEANSTVKFPSQRWKRIVRDLEKQSDDEHFEDCIFMAKLVEAKALAEKRRDRSTNPVILKSNICFSDLLDQTAKVLTKLAYRKQLNRRDKAILSHYGKLGYEKGSAVVAPFIGIRMHHAPKK